MRASTQRKEHFIRLQGKSGQTSVVLLGDVSIRWNSTLLMLVRAKRVSMFLGPLCEIKEHRSYTNLLPTSAEWAVMDLVLQIMEPFEDFTNLCSKSFETSSYTMIHMWD